MFDIYSSYTKNDIYKILNVPKDKQKGHWNKGHASYDNMHFIFANIGIAGSGFSSERQYDYNNFFDEDGNLNWITENNRKQNSPIIQSLLSSNPYLFIREEGTADKHWEFVGIGNSIHIEGNNPVKIVWNIDTDKTYHFQSEKADVTILREGKKLARSDTNQIILQPAGNKDSREHYEDTITNLVSLRRIEQYLESDDMEILRSIYKDHAPLWGVTPGKKSINFKKWKRVRVGDVCLFSRDKHIFSSAVVAHKVHSKRLALDLWQRDAAGSTWEYIYFLDEVKKHNIPYKDFNRSVGYKSNYVIQGFDVLSPEKSHNVFEDFNLSSSIHLDLIDDKEFHNTVQDMDELSGKHLTLTRKEQGKWRKMLFPTGTRREKCGICKNEYTIDMLVCAHIKKRSKCSIDEQKDFNNIVPMCKFGCDDLFEKGYITVVNGRIMVNNKGLTEPMLKYLSNIDGNKCDFWIKSNNDKYFQWHHEYHNQ